MHSYDTDVSPPGPFIEVMVTNTVRGITHPLKAKLDTGAAISVLPDSAVEALRLIPRGEVMLSGYDNVSTVRSTYYVNVEMAGFHLPFLEVVSSPRKDMLLGRDVLNHFTLILRGKDLTFELRDP